MNCFNWSELSADTFNDCVQYARRARRTAAPLSGASPADVGRRAS